MEYVPKVVFEEVNGPSALLRYRATQQKVREVHGLKTQRQLVPDVMYQLNPEALEYRMSEKRKKRIKEHFI